MVKPLPLIYKITSTWQHRIRFCFILLTWISSKKVDWIRLRKFILFLLEYDKDLGAVIVKTIFPLQIFLILYLYLYYSCCCCGRGMGQIFVKNKKKTHRFCICWTVLATTWKTFTFNTIVITKIPNIHCMHNMSVC
jgi:hypothetical protein